MKSSSTLLACLALCLCSCGVRPQKRSKPGTLKWYAERAKARGEDHVEIAEVCQCEDGDLDGALKSGNYSVLVGTPTTSTAQAGKSWIETWYKFRVSETLWDATRCAMCTAAEPIPTALSVLSNKDLAIPIGRGTTVVEGVRISFYAKRAPALETGQTYLMFLRGTLGSSQVKGIGGSQEWIFKINADGTLSGPPRPETQLSEDVLSLGSLERVRRYIASRKMNRG